MRPLKSNVVYIIISILHEDIEAQRQDQLDNLQGPVQNENAGPLVQKSLISSRQQQ